MWRCSSDTTSRARPLLLLIATITWYDSEQKKLWPNVTLSPSTINSYWKKMIVTISPPSHPSLECGPVFPLMLITYIAIFFSAGERCHEKKSQGWSPLEVMPWKVRTTSTPESKASSSTKNYSRFGCLRTGSLVNCLLILRKADWVSGNKVVQVEVSWLRGRPLCCSKESLSPLETGEIKETLQLLGSS